MVSIFFHVFRYLIYQEYLPGHSKWRVIRNHAYQRKKKNSSISKIWETRGRTVNRCHKLMGSIGSGHNKSIWWNHIKVSTNIWVSIPSAIPLPTVFISGFFFISENIANTRYTIIRVKKLCENVLWKLSIDWAIG